PDKDGQPLLSLRLKVFYAALQDLRALKLAESLVGREKTMEVLEKGIEKIRFDKYPHSDEWQLECRERINSLCMSAIKND
ncbi:MAG: DUF4091 domain-containing protein, partial [Clostridia bacterium]|nr:DUF4091 domain-containing protein [Clostridia bacterium]